MGLNSNKERKAWWEAMHRRYTKQEIDAAMATLPPGMQQVIRLHYGQGVALQEITVMLQRNMTTIRTRQVMGIYRLWQYFGKPDFLFPVP